MVAPLSARTVCFTCSRYVRIRRDCAVFHVEQALESEQLRQRTPSCCPQHRAMLTLAAKCSFLSVPPALAFRIPNSRILLATAVCFDWTKLTALKFACWMARRESPSPSIARPLLGGACQFVGPGQVKVALRYVPLSRPSYVGAKDDRFVR